MLISTLSLPQTGIFIEQAVWLMQGQLDIARLEQAWQRVVERHTVLRTAFLWQELAEPLQVVFHPMPLMVPLQRQDWRQLPASQHAVELQKFLQADRVQGFNLMQAPLLRLSLVQLGERHYDIIWTHHHILMDGWCMTLLQKEVLSFYAAYQQGQTLQLQPAHAYQEYIRWLKRQALITAEQFWRKQLQGFREPTPLGIVEAATTLAGERYGSQGIAVTEAITKQLQQLGKTYHLTLNSLVQGLWALLLSRYSGKEDVIFGATVSGRPAEIEGVEWMVGLFINTLPVRLQVIPTQSLQTWLQEIQQHNQERSAYEYCSAGQIQQWSEVGSLPLYESILVFENYPIQTAALQEVELGFDINEGQTVGAQTPYALTMLVHFGSQLHLQIIQDRRRLEDAAVAQILQHLVFLATALANANPNQLLAEFIQAIPSGEIPKIKAVAKTTSSYLAPRDAIELQLTTIWEEVLNQRPISIQDNFFELSGHSLLAMQLLARIGQQFGKNLPLATLFQGATIEQLAELLRQEHSQPWQVLVAIQPQGHKPPFFCVPGGGGNVIYLYELARHLEQPFYGLQAVGLDGETEPYHTIEAIAAHYIREIKMIQSQGPYYLGGHSFGSYVAFEMSRQLEREGQTVAKLFIFDTQAPLLSQTLGKVETDDTQVLVNLSKIIGGWAATPLNITYDLLQPLTLAEQVKYLHEELKRVKILPPHADIRQLQGYIAVHKANAAIRYLPTEPIAAPLILFQAVDQSGWEQEPISAEFAAILQDSTWGWQGLTRQSVTVQTVAGNHHTMLNWPQVQEVAERMMAMM
jgi:thioesterase domain-containing protein/acyl carrier protein